MFRVSASAAWSTLCSAETARMRRCTSFGPGSRSSSWSRRITRETSNFSRSPPTRRLSCAMASALIAYALGMGAPPAGGPSDRWIVSRLGGDPAAALGLDLGDECDLGRWWVAACLYSGGAAEELATQAFRALSARDLDTPAALAAAAPEAIARILEQARMPRAEARAGTLVRACRALCARHGGSLARLAADAEGLDELAARLARLARGVGTATVVRFLRPRRSVWPAAADLPLSPAAQAAAAHLGVVFTGDPDLEAALERLGRRACLRGRTERCPLGPECPARCARPSGACGSLG